MHIKTIQTSNNFILDVGMEKEHEQELRRRTSIIPISVLSSSWREMKATTNTVESRSVARLCRRVCVCVCVCV